jgi:hypothetical protein
LSSNNTLLDLATYAINGQTIPHIEKSSSYHSTVRCIINYLYETYGGKNLPSILRHSTVSDMIARGQPEETLCLVEILYRISRNQPITSPSPSPDSHPRKKKSDLKNEKRKKEKLLEFVMNQQKPQTAQSHGAPSESQSKQRQQQQEKNQQPLQQHQEGHLSSGRHIKFGENQTRFIPAKDELDSETEIGPLRLPELYVCTSLFLDQSLKANIGQRGHQRHHVSRTFGSQNESPHYPSLSSLQQREGSRQELHSDSDDPVFNQRDQIPRERRQAIPFRDEEEEDFFSSHQRPNDIDLVFGDLPVNQPLDHSVSSEQRIKILRWLSTLGLCPRPPSYDPCTGAATPKEEQDLQFVDLEDDWINGVFLSELAALCSHGNRNEVKQVSFLSLSSLPPSSFFL